VELLNYEAITTAYSECVYVALVIQHAKRMRRCIMSHVASLDLPHFPPLSHKRHDFFFGGGGGDMSTGHNMRDADFSTPFFNTFHILQTIQRAITINVHKSSCNVSVTRARF